MRYNKFDWVKVQAVAVLLAASWLAVRGAWHSQAAQAVQPALAVVSAASFAREVAPDSLAVAFGTRLATVEATATDADPNLPGVQLPLTLGGTTVEVNGRRAGLIYVSPGQINFLLPPETASGTANIVVRASDGAATSGPALVNPTAPAIFTANADSRGVPAALLLRYQPDGVQGAEPVSHYDALLGRHNTRPIHFGMAGRDRVFVLLFLTGLRGAPDPNRDGNLNEVVRVTVGGVALTPDYAGRQPDLAGLDQLNLELPASLTGRGKVNVIVSINGGPSSNSVELELAAGPSGPPPLAFDVPLVMDEDATLNFALKGADQNSRPLRYIVTSLPRHGRLSGSAPNLTYTPAADYAGVDDFTYKVNNGIDDSADAGTVSFAIRQLNDPPRLTVPGPQTINVSEELSFEISATDPDVNQQLTFTMTPELPGARLADVTPRSRRFIWTPVTDQGGRSFVLTFRAFDDGNPVLSETRTVTVTVGLLWGKTSGPEGAEIAALLGDPASGNLYAGTRTGGVYRSIDGGRRWAPINGNLAVRYIYSLYRRGTRLFAGTVDGVFYTDNDGLSWRPGFRGGAVLSFAEQGSTLYAGTIGIGVRVSKDGGQTWQAGGGFIDGPLGFFDGKRVDSLVVRNNRLFAAVSDLLFRAGGLIVSTDGAENWTQIVNDLPGAGELPVSVLGTNQTHLFASLDGAGIYASTNEGQSWFPINSGLTSRLLPYLAVNGTTLVASSGGALFRSTNNGQSWSPLDTGFSNQSVIALGFNGNALLAGTSGAGIFIRTGSGANEAWQASSLGLLNSSVGALAVDETGQRLYATTSTGIYVSENNGQSWTLYNVLPPGGTGSLTISGPNLLAATRTGVYLSSRDSNGVGLPWTAPNNGLTERNVSALATLGTQVFAGTVNGVFVSTNNGQSWTSVSNGLGNRVLTGLAVSGTRVYAATQGGVYVTANGGQLWSSLGLTNYPLSHLAVNGDFLVAASRAGVFTSNDQGRNWRQITEGLDNPVSALAIRAGTAYAGSSLDGVYALADNGQVWRPVNDSLSAISARALVVSGPNLFLSTDDGVWLSTNSPQTWAPFSQNLASPQVEALFVAGGNVFAGTRGQGVYRLPAAAQDWLRTESGLPLSGTVAALTGTEAALWAGTLGNGVFRSTDQGRNWTAFNAGLLNQSVNALLGFNAQIYAGTEGGGGVYRLPEQGGTWTALNNGLSTTRIRALIANETTLFAGADLGEIFRSEDQGQNWTAASRLEAPRRPALALNVSMLARNGATLYAGTEGAGLYRSANGGRNWMPVAPRDLGESLYVTAFVVSGARLYAGTSSGVFFSTDQGESWRQINAGLASVYVKSLAVIGGKVYAGTVDRGVFISKIPE